MSRRMIMSGEAGAGVAQAARIAGWQNGQTNLVQVVGLPIAQHSADSNVTGNATGGRTLISGVIAEGCIQDGFIRQIKVWVQAIGDVGGWKFKIFRPNGTNYDFVGESEAVTPAATGEQTFTLTTPIACQPADILGVFLPKGTVVQNAIGVDNAYVAANTIRFLAGDQSGLNINFSSTLANVGMSLGGLSYSPYLAVTGDSIPEGHNVGSPWHSIYDGGPTGTATSEIMNQLRGLIGSGTVLQYQNRARGSQTFAWVASTGIVACHAIAPNKILVHCGVNDIATGRTWAQVEADLNTIKTAITTEQLLIGEILPWTAGSDGQAATVRTFNANIATWCSANGATLVICHDEMGQIRVATGQLDDLKTAYNQDGVHLTQAGVDAMAAIWKRYM